jgi:hypothetical protein
MKDIISERAKTHGDYSHTSRVAHCLKQIIREQEDNLTCDQQEALEMIAVKMARIMCGNANEPDHWRDISGYAHLGGGL